MRLYRRRIGAAGVDERITPGLRDETRASSVARFNCSTSTALSATNLERGADVEQLEIEDRELDAGRGLIAAGRERRGRRQKIARHELFRLPPRFGAVAAKREQLVKDDRVGVEVNGNDLAH